MRKIKVPIRVKIEVTELDINKGRRNNDRRCPIARAFRRAVGRRDVRVSYNSIHIGLKAVYWPTLSAMTFINKFDFNGRTAVKPFSFVAKLIWCDETICQKVKAKK